MTESIDERIKRYVLDGGDADLQRLLAISDVFAAHVRAALARTGIGPGWRALDCGCGPLGALAVMAEMVGPDGRAVGVDFSDAAVQRVRSVAATLGIDNADAQVGDVHDLDAERLGGLFDVAYTRCFLMHQPDPSRTLERISSLLRSGGWIVAHEPLRSPPPRSSPSFEPLTRAWYLLHDVAERLGVPRDSVDALPMHARALGLEVVETSGFCSIVEPALGFGLHAGTTAAVRDRAVSSGVAGGDEVDALVHELRAAGEAGYAWVTTPFFLALTLRVS